MQLSELIGTLGPSLLRLVTRVIEAIVAAPDPHRAAERAIRAAAHEAESESAIDAALKAKHDHD